MIQVAVQSKLKHRSPFIDWVRGMAILLMIIYHFCYDLDLFGYIDTTFGTGYWVPFRYVIVIGFLALVGVSLVFSHHKQIVWPSVIKRSSQLLLASSLVTVSSYFIAPNKITLFGILHFILVASLLSLPLVKRPVIAGVLGLCIFVLGHTVSFAIFETIWLHWLGMVVDERPALDYVPVFPWWGMVLLGISLGHWLKFSTCGQYVSAIDFSLAPAIRVTRYFSCCLQWAGKHSLIIYLVHQPLLFAAFNLLEFI